MVIVVADAVPAPTTEVKAVAASILHSDFIQSLPDECA
jgi:hypothetical protein